MVMRTLFFSYLFFPTLLLGQLQGLSSVYDDAVQEWTVITSDEADFDGTLSVKFGWSGDDRLRWSYDVLDISGDIEVVAGSNGRLWRLTSPDGNLTLRRVWARDNSEWEITDGTASFTLRVRYPNNAEEWRIIDESKGYLDVFTLYRGDARDWAIEEVLDASYRVEHKLAALFIAMYVATGGD